MELEGWPKSQLLMALEAGAGLCSALWNHIAAFPLHPGNKSLKVLSLKLKELMEGLRSLSALRHELPALRQDTGVCIPRAHVSVQVFGMWFASLPDTHPVFPSSWTWMNYVHN